MIGPPELKPIKTKLIEIFDREKWLNQGYLAKRLLTDLCYDMRNDIVVCGRMFFYPKIHKVKDNEDLTYRPLCSSPGTVTYLTSKYLAIELRPVLRKITSHCRNSADIILELEKTILPDKGLLLIIDIVNMYPSIDIIEGIQSMRWVLKRLGYHDNHTTFLTNLANFVLRNNFVKFGQYYFKQIKGIAMGTLFAVVFSSMHIFHLETESFEILMQSAHITKIHNFKLFKRFIDDFFMWVKSREIATIFIDILNNRRKSIKITSEISDYSVNFLDLTIYKGTRFYENNILDTKPYVKPLNQHLYLPPISFHLPSIFKSWVNEFINRLRFICYDDDIFLECCQDFRIHLLDRGYDPIELGDTLKNPKTRHELLLQAKRNQTIWLLNQVVSTDGVRPPSVRFPLTYDLNTKNNMNAIRDALKMSNTFKDLDVISQTILGDLSTPNLSVSNAKNLGKLLTSNTFRSLSEIVEEPIREFKTKQFRPHC